MELIETAQEVVEQLRQHQTRLVLSESCTAGLIAATLGQIPGVSELFCGSAVVYREQTKRDWLGVSQLTLNEHTAVSSATTSEITRCVLERTKEASLALGITGHLGPNAPGQLDGAIFLATWARRDSQSVEIAARQQRLVGARRAERQREAALAGLTFLLDCLERGL